MAFCRMHGIFRGPRVRLCVVIDLVCDDDVRFKVDRMLGFVGQMRGSTLHLGDTAVRICRAFADLIGNLLAFAGLVKTLHLVDVEVVLRFNHSGKLVNAGE